MANQIRYAKLKQEDVNKLQSLEKETGKIILAYEPSHESPYATLSEEQKEQLRQLEQKWNVVLLAYSSGEKKRS